MYNRGVGGSPYVQGQVYAGGYGSAPPVGAYSTNSYGNGAFGAAAGSYGAPSYSGAGYSSNGYPGQTPPMSGRLGMPGPGPTKSAGATVHVGVSAPVGSFGNPDMWPPPPPSSGNREMWPPPAPPSSVTSPMPYPGSATSSYPTGSAAVSSAPPAAFRPDSSLAPVPAVSSVSPATSRHPSSAGLSSGMPSMPPMPSSLPKVLPAAVVPRKSVVGQASEPQVQRFIPVDTAASTTATSAATKPAVVATASSPMTAPSALAASSKPAKAQPSALPIGRFEPVEQRLSRGSVARVSVGSPVQAVQELQPALKRKSGKQKTLQFGERVSFEVDERASGGHATQIRSLQSADDLKPLDEAPSRVSLKRGSVISIGAGTPKSRASVCSTAISEYWEDDTIDEEQLKAATKLANKLAVRRGLKT